MTKTASKLRSKRGETLVEMLVSIVLLGLSISIMSVMVATAYNMNMAAREADEKYYSDLSAAEAKNNKVDTVKVSISDGTKTVDIKVDIFGGDSLRSNARSGS